MKISSGGAFFALLAVLLAMTVSIAAGLVPYRVYVIHTGSMRTTIPPTSIVIVREGAYRVGQPVAYRRGDGVITHRLMSIAANGTITTKGDANRTADPWHVPVSNIIGGVVASVPFVGWAVVYAQQLAGIASILLAIVCASLIWSIAKDLDELLAARSRAVVSVRRA